MTPEVLVVGLHLRWDGVRQRPHHLLSRFAAWVPVIVVEEPYGSDRDEDEIRFDGNVTIVRPLRKRGWGEPLVDDQVLATTRALVAGRRAGVWMYTPMMDALIDAVDASLVAYDCMDDLASFDFAPAGMREREAALIARAAIVFTGGVSLYEARKAHGAKVRCFPSGVEFERFNAARTTGPHPICAELAGPVCGYIGVIDERLDIALIEALADAPDAPQVMMVGPFAKIDPARLPRRKNIHFTGQVPYEQLPSFLAGFDVALMPFADNPSTKSISPTKTLEYFAAGVPVATTAIADVVRDYADVVHVGNDPAAFVNAVAQARAAGPAVLAKATEYARERGWDTIADTMFGELCAAGEKQRTT